MKKTLLTVAIVALMVCTVLSLVACGGTTDDSFEHLAKPELPASVSKGFGFSNDYSNTVAPETKPSEMTDITFLLDWAPNTNHTGLYVAKNKGFYEAEGLNVKFVQPDITGTSGSVAAGNAEFGIDFQEQMIFHEQNKVGVTAVSAIIQHNTSGIVSRKSLGITKPADMINHKYATWGIPGEQAVIYGLLKNGGVDPTAQAMIPNTVMDIVAEFKNPQGAECVWSYAAWDKIILDKAGIETNFIWMKDYAGLDYYTPVIVANNEYMSANPEIVKAFLRATKKGYEYAIANAKDAADILIAENPELEASKEIIYASQQYLAGEYQSDAPYWGYIDQARWDGFFSLVCSFNK